MFGELGVFLAGHGEDFPGYCSYGYGLAAGGAFEEEDAGAEEVRCGRAVDDFVEIDYGDHLAAEVEPAKEAAVFGGLEIGPGYYAFQAGEFDAVVVSAEGEEEAAADVG